MPKSMYYEITECQACHTPMYTVYDAEDNIVTSECGFTSSQYAENAAEIECAKETPNYG